jgi:trimeric autotransporter adhesin
LKGGTGNDTFVINSTSDVVTDTSSGASNILVSSVSYSLPTDVNTLSLTGTGALTGTANGATDTLIAGTAVATLKGGAGNDTFVVNNSSDVVTDTSTTASNTIQSSVSYTLVTNVNTLSLTGSGALTGTANGATDTLTAAGSAGVTLKGSTGNDTFVVNNAADVVTDTSATATNSLQASVSYTLPTDVNTLLLTGTANLVGTGNTATDKLTANAAGNDTLVAGTGASTLTGESGNDTFVISSTADVVSDTSTTASNTVESSISYTLPTHVNTLILTGTGALTGTANSATDTLIAGTAVATLKGSSGNDTFVINNSADVVTDTSTTASNTVQSSVSYTLVTNVNTLILSGTAALVGTANGATDTLIAGGTGAATLNGSTGNDTFVVNNSADVVSDTSTTATNALQASVNYTLATNVNSLLLTGSGNLIGTGNGASDSLTANSGSDTLIAGAGVATLFGAAGNETFVINNTADVITDTSATASNILQSSVTFTLPTDVNTLVLTGTGALTGTANGATDTLIAGTAVATLKGAGGNDTFVVDNTGDVVTDTSATASNTLQSSVNFTLPTNVNTLLLTGTGALIGTANGAADTLLSGTGLETLVGGNGNDVFVVNNTGDVVTDTSGTAINSVQSTVNYTLPNNVSALTLLGTMNLAGTGSSQSSTVTANTGNDTLSAGAGLTTLVGQSGNETFVVNNTGDVVTDTSSTSSNVLLSSVNYTLPTNVNSLTLTGTASLLATGNAAADVINANSGVDTLVAGSGLATLAGGAGNDTFVVNSASDVVTDTSATTSNTLQSSVSFTLPMNVNALLLTATGLVGTANTANAQLTANATGSDTLVAGLGSDTLISGASGTDSLVGGSGNDVFVVNNAADTVTDTSTTASNTLQSSVSFTLPMNVNALLLTATGLVGTANTANAQLTANATGSDTLVAGLGNDTLVSGASGTDGLVGGSGNDLFVVNTAADTVTDTSTTASNTLQASVSFTLPTNVNSLTLAAAGLVGTANAANALLTANSTGSDTLVAGTGNDTLAAGVSGVDTLVGGAGNDTFVVYSASDIVSETLATTSNTIQSTISYTLPTNINTLVLTGTGGLTGTANSSTDTLVSGTGGETLIGSSGNDTFIVNNSADIVTDTSSTASNTLESSVSYTLPTNINSLYLIGTANLIGTGNAANDLITNSTSGNATLVAGSGTDTLVAGLYGVDSLVAGSGLDTFVVNNSADVINVSAGTSDAVQSSVSFTLPTNLQYLTMTGNGVATGNTLSDLIVGGGADTLTAGTGIDALEGGWGPSLLQASSNQAALIGGNGTDTITGGAQADFYAAGLGGATITTGATANVVSVNLDAGAVTLQPTTSASNVLSLGGAIDTESLSMSKVGNNLVISDTSGDAMTFSNWYTGASNQNYTTLQVIELASPSYSATSSDPLRNQAIEEFNLSALVTQFNAALTANPSLANWSLSNGMVSAQLSSSPTSAYGGDLAYYYGLNGNLTGVDLSAVQSTLTNASFATGVQTIDSFSSITGGGGIHLNAIIRPSPVSPGLGASNSVPSAGVANDSPSNADSAMPISADAATPVASQTIAPESSASDSSGGTQGEITAPAASQAATNGVNANNIEERLSLPRAVDNISLGSQINLVNWATVVPTLSLNMLSTTSAPAATSTAAAPLAGNHISTPRFSATTVPDEGASAPEPQVTTIQPTITMPDRYDIQDLWLGRGGDRPQAQSPATGISSSLNEPTAAVMGQPVIQLAAGSDLNYRAWSIAHGSMDAEAPMWATVGQGLDLDSDYSVSDSIATLSATSADPSRRLQGTVLQRPGLAVHERV